LSKPPAKYTVSIPHNDANAPNIKVAPPTPWKNVCACVTLTEICLGNIVSSVPKVVENSKWMRLRWFAFSVKKSGIMNVTTQKLEIITSYMCKKWYYARK
jgi:hypothetical protein